MPTVSGDEDEDDATTPSTEDAVPPAYGAGLGAGVSAGIGAGVGAGIGAGAGRTGKPAAAPAPGDRRLGKATTPGVQSAGLGGPAAAPTSRSGGDGKPAALVLVPPARPAKLGAKVRPGPTVGAAAPVSTPPARPVPAPSAPEEDDLDDVHNWGNEPESAVSPLADASLGNLSGGGLRSASTTADDDLDDDADDGAHPPSKAGRPVGLKPDVDAAGWAADGWGLDKAEDW